MYSVKARILLLLGNHEEAKTWLEQARLIAQEVHTVPWQLIDYYRSRFEYDLHILKEALKEGSGAPDRDFMDSVKKDMKMLRKLARKVAHHRVASYRLIGLFHWLNHRQSKALRWWEKALEEGERQRALPELARTYLEVGLRLLGPGSRHHMLKGIKPEEWIELGKGILKELGLMWDLEEAERATMG
jgi:tetratricopeptide (TPR) repeat protein